MFLDNVLENRWVSIDGGRKRVLLRGVIEILNSKLHVVQVVRYVYVLV